MSATTSYFYVRHEGILKKECHRFMVQFGGNFEELLSDAYMGFAKCMRKWEPYFNQEVENGTDLDGDPVLDDDGRPFAFSTLLTICVRQALRYEYNRRHRRPTVSLENEELIPEKKARWPIWEELKGDAQTVAEIALNIKAKKGTSRRKLLTEALVELGLSGDRINQAIREIKEVLA